MNVEEAVNALSEGNARYAKGLMSRPNQSPERMREVLTAQRPFACVLTCSDSRVVPEMIFDAGVGDIFSIENAGNVVDDHVLGSIQYAVEHLDVPVVMVLGHTRCGAIGATLGGKRPSGKLGAVYDTLKPVVDSCPGEGEERYFDCIVENVKRSVAAVREEVPSAVSWENNGLLRIFGAVYHLETGLVEFLEG